MKEVIKEYLKEKNIEFKVRTNCPNKIIKVDLPKFKRIFSYSFFTKFWMQENVIHLSLREI